LRIINKFRLYLWDAEVTGTSPGQTVVKNLPVLKRGSRGEYVKAWQNFLNLNGYPCGLADGIFGKATESAVRDFQRSRGLDPDGIIGKDTWKAIGL